MSKSKSTGPSVQAREIKPILDMARGLPGAREKGIYCVKLIANRPPLPSSIALERPDHIVQVLGMREEKQGEVDCYIHSTLFDTTMVGPDDQEVLRILWQSGPENTSPVNWAASALIGRPVFGTALVMRDGAASATCIILAEYALKKRNEEARYAIL